MKFRHNWNNDQKEEIAARTGVDCENSPIGESKTQQSFAKDVDINELARRFGFTDGSLLPAAQNPDFYGIDEMPKDLLDAHLLMQDADDRFMMLPASIRTQFNNDFREFVPWIHDPKNLTKAQELGLLAKSAPTAGTTSPANTSTTTSGAAPTTNS